MKTLAIVLIFTELFTKVNIFSKYVSLTINDEEN